MGNLTIYVAPDERKILKQAKRTAKQNHHSISRIAMDAIRAYADHSAPDAVDAARKAKKETK